MVGAYKQTAIQSSTITMMTADLVSRSGGDLCEASAEVARQTERQLQEMRQEGSGMDHFADGYRAPRRLQTNHFGLMKNTNLEAILVGLLLGQPGGRRRQLQGLVHPLGGFWRTEERGRRSGGDIAQQGGGDQRFVGWEPERVAPV